MQDYLLRMQRELGESVEIVSLYPGIDLLYLSIESDSYSIRHRAEDNIMQINYCMSGQMVWKMENGSCIYLNPGDFSLHTMNICANSVISFPAGKYSGLVIYIDINKAWANPPQLLKDAEIFKETLRDKYCPGGTFSFLAGNEQTESIFSAFYGQPEQLKLPYQKIKILELFLYLSKLDVTEKNKLTAYKSEQIEMIREIHRRLMQSMREKITIEELSRQYLINPTTLKTAFKSVYGTSIAAHMKEPGWSRLLKCLENQI